MGRSKTDAEARTVYLTPASVAALAAKRPDGAVPLFGLSAPSISCRIRAAAAAAGLGSGFSGHSVRGHGAAHGRSRRADARDLCAGPLEDGQDGGGLYAGGGGGTRGEMVGVTSGPVPYNTVCGPSKVRGPLEC